LPDGPEGATGAPRRREDALRRAGASGDVLAELVRYDVPLLERPVAAAQAVASLSDEPHLEAWTLYASEALRDGAIAALARRFPQLHFPIRAGISGEEEYRAATRRGVWPAAPAGGLGLRDPGSVRLTIHSALVGKIPLLVVPERLDFESLVRAFACRNEPVPIPASMGACIVTGFNNWDRIGRYRDRWARANPDGDWSEEFEWLKARPSLYEDRFILLSTGYYSGIAPDEAGFPGPEWRERSLAIRREHECTHYFTFRIAGRMRNHLLDEVIADYAGLVRTFGAFRDDLARRFFGLERYPSYRAGSRLENYRGTPPLTDAALVVARRLVHGAIESLARVGGVGGGGDAALASTVVTLASRTLAEIAAPDFTIAPPESGTREAG